MSFQKEAAVYVLLSAIFSLFDEGKNHSNLNPHDLEPAGTPQGFIHHEEFSFSVQSQISVCLHEVLKAGC